MAAEPTDIMLAARMPEAFHVHDAQTANWVVRRIVEARKYAERVELWAASELRRAEREEQFFLQRYGAQLEAWARQQIDQQAKRKSVCLPAGRIGFRNEAPRLAIADEKKLLAWCKAHLKPAIVVTERIAKSIVSDHVARTGECPDGADIIGGGQKFFIK